MRKFFLLVSFLFMGLLLALISTDPLVVKQEALRVEDGIGAGGLLRRLKTGLFRSKKRVVITFYARELNNLGAFASRAHTGLAVKSRIGEGAVRLEATYQLPSRHFPLFLNASIRVRESQKGLEIERMTIGHLSVPGALVKPLMIRGANAYLGENLGTKAFNAIRKIGVEKDRANVEIVNPGELAKLLKNRKFSVQLVSDPRLVRLYHKAIVAVGREKIRQKPVSLAEFMPPLFALARDRSMEGEAIAENEALILALAMVFGDYRVENLIGDVLGPLRRDPAYHFAFNRGQVRLGGRHDLVRHFTLSAALAIISTQGLAGALGELKESRDTAPGGTGFSFVDLGADRAGMRFAKVALASEDRAQILQEIFADEATEGIFFPSILDLPEWLSARNFRTRYENLESENYQAALVEIDRRINLCPAYQVE